MDIVLDRILTTIARRQCLLELKSRRIALAMKAFGATSITDGAFAIAFATLFATGAAGWVCSLIQKDILQE